MLSFQGSFQWTAIFHNAIVEANCRWGLLLLEPSLWTAFNPQYSDWTLPVTCGHWYTPTCWPASSNNDHLLHKSHGQNYNLTDKWPGCAHTSPLFAFRSSSSLTHSGGVSRSRPVSVLSTPSASPFDRWPQFQPLQQLIFVATLGNCTQPSYFFFLFLSS